MNVSPNELRKETVATLRLADEGLKSSNLTDEVRATLLLTKAQCLNTLTLLNEKRNK
jgi:hypothetical protein